MRIAGILVAFLPAVAFAHVSPVFADAAVDMATQSQPACANGSCHVQMTATQVLARAEAFVAAKDYVNAKPFVEMLAKAPEFALQSQFLKGFIAAETGDLKTAETTFRAILRDHPTQTRVRLELARLMLMQGKEGSADYNFRLAQQDKDLPSEIAQTIRSARGVLRDKRKWHLNVDLGLAPDTNINSATSAESVNINFGPFQLPLTLNPNARAQSGIGQTGSISAGYRLRASDKIAILFDADGRGVNYKGTFADDFQVQAAAGPEIRIGKTASVSIQALGEQRWYGGKVANRDYGVQVGFQKVLDAGQRIGLALDARRSDSQFSDAYSGEMYGGNITYERVVGRAFIASASLFGRVDSLNSKAYSDKSFGASLGIGGELPWGINAGLNGSVSRALYQEPQYLYSNDKRQDWRFFSRAYLGLRSFKLLGFSPSVEYTFSKIDSNYTLYRSDRHRFNFKLARYF